ncbi:hypothetical protein [Methylovulum psychrotolerans]|uniref:hypothetical protein n=1 Tax=Methylovulum psychrotolerans TaxID=1704499 RepID=UPI0012FA46E3|nr:hypothetical protein [Methylovulum psychrotolerans]
MLNEGKNVACAGWRLFIVVKAASALRLAIFIKVSSFKLVGYGFAFFLQDGGKPMPLAR